MSETPSLFGDEPTNPAEQAAEPMPITDWLVEKLRQALDSEGLSSMALRQERIERAAGRPVESLRALTYQEGVKVLAAIGKNVPAPAARRTAWDERDDDTWIDRL